MKRLASEIASSPWYRSASEMAEGRIGTRGKSGGSVSEHSPWPIQKEIDEMSESELADMAVTLVYILLGSRALQALVTKIEARQAEAR